NLDAKLRLELRSQIRQVCKDSGLTTVYVTHDQKEALSMADRVAIMREGRVCQIGTPRELYRRPNSRFVAAFLGEADFLHAKVAEAGGGVVRLETPGGVLVADASGATGESPPTAGQAVTVCVRPECWRVVDAGTPGSLRATLLSTTYLGEIAQYVLELDSKQRVHAAVLNPALTPAQSPGDAVGLEVEPRDVIVLSGHETE
ncbi:MAG: ABC transporter ATP-binding protein, partial [Phycisphaerales bacterium JB041]